MANTTPIYVKAGVVSWNATNILTGNTTVVCAGTIGTNVGYLHSAGADGDYIEKITVVPLGTNTATVIRLFLNNGGVTTDATNNELIGEIHCPATTISQVSAQNRLSIDINQKLPAGYRLYYTVGTSIAAGFAITVWGGTYTDV